MDKDIKEPMISVVMSVYNGDPYLAEAIESVLSQSFKDFEFIIINDGSTDDTKKILASFVDPRLNIIEQKNQGLVASLNTGISMARGKYIARQDADDASLPTRFDKQVQVLEAYEDIVIVGSSMKVMNEESTILHTHHVLLNDPELREELLVRSPFAHGSVMFRREAALKAGLYAKFYWPAEDYDLWLRLSKYGKLANINEPLYIYRENTEGISIKNHEIQQEKTALVQELAWENRKRLLSSKPIKLNNYTGLEDGESRKQRIIANVSFAYRKARDLKSPSTAVRAGKLLANEPAVYRKFLGKVKRRLKK